MYLKSTLAVSLLTSSIPNTIARNIQIRLLLEDIQQLKAKVKIKQLIHRTNSSETVSECSK